MNVELPRDRVPDEFVSESLLLGRLRFERLLETLGYELVQVDRADDAVLVRRRKNGRGFSGLSVGINCVARFYDRLHRDRLRSPANPIRIDRWHLMSPAERYELKMLVHGQKAGHVRYTGVQYVAVVASPSPIRMEDPIGLLARVLTAGRARNWPRSIVDLVTLMGEDGCRFEDCHNATAYDWWIESRFGRTIDLPNKGSSGARVKSGVMTSPSAVQLRQSFDLDPKRPDMRQLEALSAAEDWNALKKIYLFPSGRGLPYSYHCFNNHYFRPAMEEGAVTISSATGTVRVTPHRLRAGVIQEAAEKILRSHKTKKQQEDALGKLMDDMHLKSTKSFRRYLGNLKKRIATESKVSRFDERMSGRPASPPPSAPIFPAEDEYDLMLEEYA